MAADPPIRAARVTGGAWSDLGRFRAGGLSSDRPVLLGVASGLAPVLGASVLVVRVAFGVLTLAAGWGVLAYAGAWVLLRDGEGSSPRPVTLRHNLGVVAATAAQVALIDGFVRGVQPALLWPVSLVAFSVALAEPGDADRGRRSANVGRVLAGAVLMVAGLLSGMAGSLDARELLRTAPAALVLVGGLVLVMAPWLRRVVADADADRLRRAQAEARAHMAAHLHDSVLQTLTLIQNRSAEPEIAAALAHRQERELRRWLYSTEAAAPDASPTFRVALEAAAAEVEDQYLKVVECVVVGDMPMTEPLQAVVGAAREAMVNAAKFAGAPSISVYAEVDHHQPDDNVAPGVRAFVRDRGVGFDPNAVPDDRHGISDSIRGRVERVGGAASVRSRTGGGTEVGLRWPK